MAQVFHLAMRGFLFLSRAALSVRAAHASGSLNRLNFVCVRQCRESMPQIPDPQQLHPLQREYWVGCGNFGQSLG